MKNEIQLTHKEGHHNIFTNTPQSIFSLAIALMLMRCAESLFVPVLPLYVRILDASIPLFIIGLVTSINRLGIVLITPAAGSWCDRIGYGKPYLVGVFLASGACILGGISAGAIDLGLYRLLSGMGYGAVTLATMAFANRVTTPENRATAMSLISASMLAGAAIGPLPGGYIAQSFPTLLSGYRATFFVGGLIELLVGIFTFFIMINHPRKEMVGIPETVHKSFLTRNLLANKGVSMTCSASFLFGIAHGAFLYFTVPLLGDTLGFRPFEIGWIISAFGAGHVIGSLIFGPISDQLNRRKPFIFMGFFGPGVVILFFTLVNNLALMVFSTFVLGVVTSPCCGIVPALIAESAAETPAAAMGVGKSAEQLGLFVGPIVGGILIPHLGFSNAMLLYAAMTMAGSLIFIMGVPEPLSLKTGVKS
jgi:predicted MFS family arabinose efflux permease